MGDVVNVKVDFAKKTVVFTCNSLVYEMPIRLDLGPIYAFAGPTHNGDTIAIV